MSRWRNTGNYKKRSWTMEWVTYLPNVGHVLTQYIDGKAVWLAGVKV
jgi:hypothetical protein